MEVLTIKTLITTIIQLPILLLFYTYILDLKWSKKTLLFIILIIFLPTVILSLFIGASSMLYFLVILSVIIYRETKVISHILHVLRHSFF